MNFPDRETVEHVQNEFPAGCRIVLDQMDDPYTKIPIGMQGTVMGVDDILNCSGEQRMTMCGCSAWAAGKRPGGSSEMYTHIEPSNLILTREEWESEYGLDR